MPEAVVTEKHNEISINQVTEDYKYHRELMFQLVLDLKCKKLIELGTDVGDSMRIFSAALNVTGGTMWSVDINECPQQWPIPANVNLIKSNTLDLNINEPIDLLYIDDNHTHDHVLAELERFGKWVRKDGKILLHDIVHTQFGSQITMAIIEWCYRNQLPWTSLPEGHGMAVIHVTKDLQAPLNVPAIPV